MAGAWSGLDRYRPGLRRGWLDPCRPGLGIGARFALPAGVLLWLAIYAAAAPWLRHHLHWG